MTILKNVSLFLSLPQHFQSVLQTLEEQVAGERQRLVETHLARVVATLNNNRRLALESYLSAVQSNPPQVRPLKDNCYKNISTIQYLQFTNSIFFFLIILNV